jgi:hypothetical protein
MHLGQTHGRVGVEQRTRGVRPVMREQLAHDQQPAETKKERELGWRDVAGMRRLFRLFRPTALRIN